VTCRPVALAAVLLAACTSLLEKQPPAAPAEPVEHPATVPAIVLPERAFLEALGTAAHYQVHGAGVRLAAKLAAQAGAPGTTALVATLEPGEGQRAFSGTIFLVVRDPSSAAPGRRVTSRDFYVAAVELRGSSPWLARGAAFVVDPAQAAAASLGGTCCGPSTICVPDAPGPGGPGRGVLVKVFESGPGGVQATAFEGSCTPRVPAPGCGVAKPVCEPDDTG